MHAQTTGRLQKVLGVFHLDFKELRFNFTVKWWENPCKVEFSPGHTSAVRKGDVVRSGASISGHSSGGCGLQEGGQRQHSSRRRWVAWLVQNVITPPSQCHTTQQNLTAASKWGLPNELTLRSEQCRTYSLEKYLQSVIFLILLVQAVQASTHLWHAASSGSSVVLFGGMAAVICRFSSSVSHCCWQ